MASSSSSTPEVPSAPLLSFARKPSTESTRARSGQLTFTARDDAASSTPTRVVPTPALIAYSSRGAIPHLTRDNVARLPNEMVHLALEHLMDQPKSLDNKTTPLPIYSQAPFSLHRFVGLHENKSQRQQLLTLSLRDAADRALLPANMDDSAMVHTTQGVRKVTPRFFLDATLPRPPDILFAFGDDPVERTSNKRLEKSVRRSLDWVAEVAEGAKGHTNVFAPLVGDAIERCRSEYSNALLGVSTSRATQSAQRNPGQSTIDSNIAGYSLTISPSLAPTGLDPAVCVPSFLRTSLDPLPSSKPRVIHRAAGPHDILRCVRDVGIDLFVEEWSSQCATIGVGLDFAFPVVSSRSTTSPPSTLSTSSKLDIGHSFFDNSFDRAFVPLSASPLAAPPAGYSDPFGPSPTTRAYVHHLLQAHEMTAHVILALHNHLVMSAFFTSIRELLAQGSDAFELEVIRFFDTYEEGRAFSGGQYPCLKLARIECELVDRQRGKGSLKEKSRLAAAETQETETMAPSEAGARLPLE